MAYKVEVIRGATTYTLSDPGNSSVPFSIEEADLGGASVRNIEESGPYQDGATHLDERLEPDTITLRINVVGASASALDGHRDTLNTMFKPVRGVPITLKLTRDDGTVRQLDTRRTGKLAIPLIAQNRPGNLHRAVVQLRAADPTWYNPTAEEETFSAPVGDWWRAYSTIGTANVLEHVESPTQGQLWANSGSVSPGSAFTIMFRSALGTPVTGAGIWAFRGIFNGGLSQPGFVASSSTFGGYQATLGDTLNVSDVIMTAGTHDYFLVSHGTAMSVYRDNTLIGEDAGTSYGIPGTAAGTATARVYWRSDHDLNPSTYWPPALPYAAVYNVALDSNQRSALSANIDDAGLSGSAYSAPVVYVGDIDSYPVITITGPMANPVITNTTTGDVLDFTGGTVGSAEIWTIDTRYGRKSALFGTTSVASYLSEDSDLSTFRLVPAPLAAGGTNTITVSSTNAGTAASVVLSYYTRYLSF